MRSSKSFFVAHRNSKNIYLNFLNLINSIFILTQSNAQWIKNNQLQKHVVLQYEVFTSVQSFIYNWPLKGNCPADVAPWWFGLKGGYIVYTMYMWIKHVHSSLRLGMTGVHDSCSSYSPQFSSSPPCDLTALFNPLGMMMWIPWILLAAANVNMALWNEPVFHTVS